MKTLSFLALTICVLGSGCTSVRKGTSTERINEIALTKRASIQMDNGLTVKGDGLRIATDSTYWIDPSTMTPQAAPTSMITAVSFPSRSVGGNLGALYGAVALGAMEGTNGGSGGLDLGAASIGALFGALPGAVLGFVVGGKAKHPISHPVQDNRN
ncbi:MAG: hypothetical protein ACI84D_003549 [Thalassolituus oleivorans]|jgi:uncharacterized protein YceK